MTQKEAIQNILSIPLKQCPVNPVQYNASTICRFYNKDYGCVCSSKSGYIANKWGCTFVTDTEFITINSFLKKAETAPKEKFVGINALIKRGGNVK